MVLSEIIRSWKDPNVSTAFCNESESKACMSHSMVLSLCLSLKWRQPCCRRPENNIIQHQVYQTTCNIRCPQEALSSCLCLRILSRSYMKERLSHRCCRLHLSELSRLPVSPPSWQ